MINNATTITTTTGTVAMMVMADMVVTYRGETETVSGRTHLDGEVFLFIEAEVAGHTFEVLWLTLPMDAAVRVAD